MFFNLLLIFINVNCYPANQFIVNKIFVNSAFGQEKNKLINSHCMEKKFLVKINDMIVERGNHSMTLLLDGRVLITGGVAFNKDNNSQFTGNNIQTLKSAEIFDPKTNEFSKISDMNLAHSGHHTILLKSGSVLILDDNQCEIFNPNTNKFTLAGKLKTSVDSAFLMPDSNALIIGIENNKNAEKKLVVEIYDTKTNSSKIVNKFQFDRHNSNIVKLNDNKIFLVGGFQFIYKNNGPLKSELVKTAEIYDYLSNKITCAANINLPRQDASATLLDSGEILIAGGQDDKNVQVAQSEIYNPYKNKFTVGASMIKPKSNLKTLKLANGEVVFIGGNSVIEKYNTKSNKFELIEGTDLGDSDRQNIIMLKNNNILITGGFKNAYDTVKDSWLLSIK